MKSPYVNDLAREFKTYTEWIERVEVTMPKNHPYPEGFMKWARSAQGLMFWNKYR